MITSKEPERTPKVYLNSNIGAVDSEIENVTSVPDPHLSINDQLRWKLFVPGETLLYHSNRNNSAISVILR